MYDIILLKINTHTVKYGSIVEFIWTLIPALILILHAS
nr:cytochrome C oxidase transmembrane region [Schizosaccharomyces pombe]Q10345.1 PUTATIVE PSEUDOGENE: RecName: Full=Putative uncharacterized protein SPAC1F12.03c [Schizosaccharomyces pombe 972h-]CAA93807.1 cytochrome C oxidase transmembrane region [Schizosaccharomyces pombe]|eukprot:NP_594329.1 cytochrome C oxidase transmembrane region [Schizosaccharomyces pombe]